MSNFDLSNNAMFKQQAFINGQWITATDGKTQEVVDPDTQHVIGTTPFLGAKETNQAIEAAHSAFPAWRKLTGQARGEILMRWHALIKQNIDALAELMTAETGKPLNQSYGEVSYGASFVEWFAEEGKRAYGEIIPASLEDRRFMVMKQAIGVTAAITPWNLPFACVTRKVAPALAAGCTQVLKPAPETPYSALALAHLLQEAGLPDGVLNIVTGDAPAIGSALTSHKAVRAVSFTGSTGVGKLLARQCADQMKKPSLELGGNAAFIVFEDADIHDCVNELMASKFRNSGQTCVCANRILVQASIFDSFSKALTERVAKMTTGSGMEDKDMGPLINQAGFDKVDRHVKDALAKGAKALTGGAPHAKGGLYYQPTVLTNINDDMQLNHEETFGPVAPLFSFDTEEQAIEIANNTEYGLASYVYTKDVSRVFRVAEALESGMVGVNAGIISNAAVPFGGVKESGLGREGSRHGLDDFMEMKYIHLKLDHT